MSNLMKFMMVIVALALMMTLNAAAARDHRHETKRNGIHWPTHKTA